MAVRGRRGGEAGMLQSGALGGRGGGGEGGEEEKEPEEEEGEQQGGGIVNPRGGTCCHTAIPRRPWESKGRC